MPANDITEEMMNELEGVLGDDFDGEEMTDEGVDGAAIGPMIDGDAVEDAEDADTELPITTRQRRVGFTSPGGGEEETKEQYDDDYAGVVGEAGVAEAVEASTATSRKPRASRKTALTAEEVLETVRQQAENNELDDLDEEDNQEAINTLQKLSENVRKEYLLNYHNDLKQLNYNEIVALAKVERDMLGNVIDPLHTTVPFLTKYERARILGVRAKQINSGAEPFITVDEKIIDGYVIAEMELREKKIPFIISRPLPDGQIEYWRVADLELLEY